MPHQALRAASGEQRGSFLLFLMSGMNLTQVSLSGATRPMNIRNECTLLELVQTVSASARNDEEVVATVAYLVNSGRVRLCGTFAGSRIALRPSLQPFLAWARATPELTRRSAEAA
jgi:hypothetical protein